MGGRHVEGQHPCRRTAAAACSVSGRPACGAAARRQRGQPASSSASVMRVRYSVAGAGHPARPARRLGADRSGSDTTLVSRIDRLETCRHHRRAVAFDLQRHAPTLRPTAASAEPRPVAAAARRPRRMWRMLASGLRRSCAARGFGPVRGRGVHPADGRHGHAPKPRGKMLSLLPIDVMQAPYPARGTRRERRTRHGPPTTLVAVRQTAAASKPIERQEPTSGSTSRTDPEREPAAAPAAAEGSFRPLRQRAGRLARVEAAQVDGLGLGPGGHRSPGCSTAPSTRRWVRAWPHDCVGAERSGTR